MRGAETIQSTTSQDRNSLQQLRGPLTRFTSVLLQWNWWMRQMPAVGSDTAGTQVRDRNMDPGRLALWKAGFIISVTGACCTALGGQCRRCFWSGQNRVRTAEGCGCKCGANLPCSLWGKDLQEPSRQQGQVHCFVITFTCPAFVFLRHLCCHLFVDFLQGLVGLVESSLPGYVLTRIAALTLQLA